MKFYVQLEPLIIELKDLEEDWGFSSTWNRLQLWIDEKFGKDKLEIAEIEEVIE